MEKSGFDDNAKSKLIGLRYRVIRARNGNLVKTKKSVFFNERKLSVQK